MRGSGMAVRKNFAHTFLERIIQYRADFHMKPRSGPTGPDMSPNPQELVLDRPKVDDPAGSLKSFIRMVGEKEGSRKRV